MSIFGGGMNLQRESFFTMNMISIWCRICFGKQEHKSQLRNWFKRSCEVPCNKYDYLMTHQQLIVSKRMLNLIFSGIKTHQVDRALKRGKLQGKIAR